MLLSWRCTHSGVIICEDMYTVHTCITKLHFALQEMIMKQKTFEMSLCLQYRKFANLISHTFTVTVWLSKISYTQNAINHIPNFVQDKIYGNLLMMQFNITTHIATLCVNEVNHLSNMVR